MSATSKIHPFPLISRELPPPRILASNRSSKDSSLIVIDDEPAYHSVGTTVSSGSKISSGVLPENDAIVSYQSTLASRHHPYRRYFEQKTYLIKKLEREAEAVLRMSVREFDAYKREHCPCINSRVELLNHDFHWIAHYQKQISNVLNYNGKTS